MIEVKRAPPFPLVATHLGRKLFQRPEVLYDFQKDGSRYDKFFPDWIPNSIASNICQPKGGDKQDTGTGTVQCGDSK